MEKVNRHFNDNVLKMNIMFWDRQFDATNFLFNVMVKEGILSGKSLPIPLRQTNGNKS